MNLVKRYGFYKYILPIILTILGIIFLASGNYLSGYLKYFMWLTYANMIFVLISMALVAKHNFAQSRTGWYFAHFTSFILSMFLPIFPFLFDNGEIGQDGIIIGIVFWALVILVAIVICIIYEIRKAREILKNI